MDESGASHVALVIKNLPANARDARDAGSILELGRFSEGEHGNPLQYSCLENPWTKEPGGLWSIRSQSQTQLNWFSTYSTLTKSMPDMISRTFYEDLAYLSDFLAWLCCSISRSQDGSGKYIMSSKISVRALSWWSSVSGSTFQCRGHGFDPWSRN